MLICRNVLSQAIEYRILDGDNAKSYDTLHYSEDCETILEIKDDDKYQFKDDSQLSDIAYKCNLFLKGKKVKKGSGKLIGTGVKVKDGVVRESVKVKDEVVRAKDAIVKETGMVIDASIETGAKIKGGIAKGSGKLKETGTKVTEGVKSFFKGIFGE